MEREDRHRIFSPAAAERMRLPSRLHRPGSDMMSPASHVTADASSCSSRLIGPVNADWPTHHSGYKGHHFAARVCSRGSMQAKVTPHPQQRLLNTSLPYRVHHYHDSSVLTPSTSFYHNHNVSCPSRTVPHTGARNQNVLTPKLMYLRDPPEHPVRGRPSNLVCERDRQSHLMPSAERKSNSVTARSAPQYRDQEFRGRTRYPNNEQFTRRNVLVHDQPNPAARNAGVDFSDDESVHPEDSMSCIQTRIGSLIHSHNWDQDHSLNKITRTGVRQPAHLLLRTDMSAESLPRAADDFRDSSAPEVDLTVVKDEPCSDDDVRTIDSPPSQSPANAASPNSVIRENMNNRNHVILNSSGRLDNTRVMDNSSRPILDKETVRDNEATVVENWTIKYSKGAPARTARILGYPSGHNQIWKSNVIKERISRDLLLTASGKTYHLHGPLDAVTSKNLGLSDTILTVFKNGFPENWMSVLEEWAESSGSEEEEEQEEVVRNFEEEMVHNFEEDVVHKFEEHLEEESVASEDDRLEVQPAKIPKSKETSRAANRRSARKNPKKTKSGVKSDAERQSSKEAPLQRRANRSRIITSDTESQNDEITKGAMETDEQKKVKEEPTKKLSHSKKVNKHSKTEVGKEKKSKKDAPNIKNNNKSVTMETPRQERRTPIRKTGVKDVKIIKEPTAPLSIERLPRTSSGRRVKPVLAWWAGQRVFCNNDVVEIVCDASKEALKKENVSILNFEVTPRGKAFFSETLKNSRKTPKSISKASANGKKRGKSSASKDTDLSQTVTSFKLSDAEVEGEKSQTTEEFLSPGKEEIKNKKERSLNNPEERDEHPDCVIIDSPKKTIQVDKKLPKRSKKIPEQTERANMVILKRTGLTEWTSNEKEKKVVEIIADSADEKDEANMKSTASESEYQGSADINRKLQKFKRSTRIQNKVFFSSQESLPSTDEGGVVQSRSPVKLNRNARRKYRERKSGLSDIPTDGTVDTDRHSSRSRAIRRTSRKRGQNVINDTLDEVDKVSENDLSPERKTNYAVEKKAALNECNVSLVALSKTDRKVSGVSVGRRSVRTKKRPISHSSQEDDDFQNTSRTRKKRTERKRTRRNQSDCEDEDYEFSD